MSGDILRGYSIRSGNLLALNGQVYYVCTCVCSSVHIFGERFI